MLLALVNAAVLFLRKSLLQVNLETAFTEIDAEVIVLQVAEPIMCKELPTKLPMGGVSELMVDYLGSHHAS
jgi:hypothetical protein